jgi:hypothetical protein
MFMLARVRESKSPSLIQDADPVDGLCRPYLGKTPKIRQEHEAACWHKHPKLNFTRLPDPARMECILLLPHVSRAQKLAAPNLSEVPQANAFRDSKDGWP